MKFVREHTYDVTGKTNSPDLYTVMQLLGKERTESRIRSALAQLG